MKRAARLAARLLLLPLAAFFALPAHAALTKESSRASVRESSPPASLATTRADAVGLPASLAPAAAADIEAAEPPLFDLGDVVLVERELAREERFHLGPLRLVDLNLLRGPPPSYPETRVGGFELLPPFRVGASPSLSLWGRQACGFTCLGLVSDGPTDGPEDPWGLASPKNLRRATRGENSLVADLLADGWIVFWGGGKGEIAHGVTNPGPDVFGFHLDSDTLAFFDDKNWNKDLVSRVNNLENLEKSKHLERARDAVYDSNLPIETKRRLLKRLNVSTYVPGVTRYKKFVSGAAAEAEVARVGPRLSNAGVEFFDVSRKGRVLRGSKVKRMLKRAPYVKLAVVAATFLATEDKAEAALQVLDPTGLLGNEQMVTSEQESVGMIRDLQQADLMGKPQQLSIMTEEEWRAMISRSQAASPEAGR